MDMSKVVLTEGVSWQGKIDRAWTGSPWETMYRMSQDANHRLEVLTHT